jgi:hypothetical protein
MSVVKRGRRGSASSPTICVGSYRGYDDLANKHHLALMGTTRETTAAGALISMSINYSVLYDRATVGAKP